jgi:hypothetical protein
LVVVVVGWCTGKYKATNRSSRRWWCGRSAGKDEATNESFRLVGGGGVVGWQGKDEATNESSQLVGGGGGRLAGR